MCDLSNRCRPLNLAFYKLINFFPDVLHCVNSVPEVFHPKVLGLLLALHISTVELRKCQFIIPPSDCHTHPLSSDCHMCPITGCLSNIIWLKSTFYISFPLFTADMYDWMCILRVGLWKREKRRDGEKQSAQSSVLGSRRKLIRDWWIDSPP